MYQCLKCGRIFFSERRVRKHLVEVHNVKNSFSISFFKFLEERKAIDFVLVGIIKVLVAIYIYALTLFNPGYSLGLEFDFLPRSSSYLVEYIRDLSP